MHDLTERIADRIAEIMRDNGVALSEPALAKVIAAIDDELKLQTDREEER